MLRLVGKFHESIAMGKQCLAEMARSSSDRWRLRHDLSISLIGVNSLDGALDMLLEIQAEGGHVRSTKKLMCEIVEQIEKKCDVDGKWIHVKERALLAHLELGPSHGTMK